MLGALTAETMKLWRHRGLWGLVWIFPLGLALLILLSFGIEFSHGAAMRLRPPPTADSWINDTQLGWRIIGSGPARLLIGAFAALAFGGEYGWNTWKLITLHRRRLMLILSKYLVVLGLLLVASLIMALILLLLGLVSPALRGQPMPQGVTFGALLAAHGKAALAALFPVLLSIGYGSLAAILTRSMLGGAIVSVAAVTAEGLANTFAPILDKTLYLALPSYHLTSLTGWIMAGGPSPRPLPSGILSEDWKVSLAFVLAWIVALCAGAAIAFDRQDLN